jgi:hypothetical protein
MRYVPALTHSRAFCRGPHAITKPHCVTDRCECNELTPLRVKHGDFLPRCAISAVHQSGRRFSAAPACRRGVGKSLGHVWTAPPWQELSDLLQHWSGAVMCPACLCGCEAAGHNALRGSGPNQKHAFEDALTQAGSPDPRIDLVCITSSCPRQFLQNFKRRHRCLASPP